MPRGAFYLLFVVSGFAGLIYESIWSHYLKLFLGHAAYAQSLVLAVFSTATEHRVGPPTRGLSASPAAVSPVSIRTSPFVSVSPFLRCDLRSLRNLRNLLTHRRALLKNRSWSPGGSNPASLTASAIWAQCLVSCRRTWKSSLRGVISQS